MITDNLKRFGQVSGVLADSDPNSDGDPEIDSDWFSDPRAGWDLHKNNKNWQALHDLISIPLGARISGSTTEAIPSPFDPSVTWFTVPKSPLTAGNKADQPSGMYVAIPTVLSTEHFPISMGLMKEFSSTLTLFAELPVLEFPSTNGKLLVFGTPDHPLRIGAHLTSSDGSQFTLNNQSFKIVRFLVSLEAQKPPSVEIDASTDGSSFDSPPISFDEFKQFIDPLLGADLVSWLDQTVPDSEQSYGTLLQDIHVLTSDSMLNAQAALQAITLPLLLGALFTSLFKNKDSNKIHLLQAGVIQAGGISSEGIFVVRRKNAANQDYGLYVKMNDILLPLPLSIDKFLLQIGKDIGKDKDVEWTKSKKDPGLSLFLVTSGVDPGTEKVATELNLVSLGYDYLAQGKDPLLKTTNGFSLDGFLSRLYLSETNSADFTFGAVGKVLNLVIPLSGLAASSKKKSEGSPTDPKNPPNPVPQKLLEDAAGTDRKNGNGTSGTGNTTSGTGTGTGGTGTDKKKTGDAQKKVKFSFSAAQDANQQFDFQLYDDDDKRTDTIWFPIDVGIGKKKDTDATDDSTIKKKEPAKSVLDIKKIGVEWKNDSRTLGLLVTGDLNVGPVKISVFGFGIEIPVTDPRSTNLTLDGGQVTFAQPSEKFELSGGLVRSKGADGVKYIGELMFKVDTFAFTLFAGYGNAPSKVASTSPGTPAMFVFLRVDYPIGGPEEFFLNGVCGGFGYNMLLNTPSIKDLPDFPLIAGTDPKNNHFKKGDSPLEALADFLKITPGEIWIAVGVIGTTYKIVNSTILLAVEFGNDLIIEILGLSTIRLPEKEDEDAIVQTQMALRAVYDNNLGILGVEAQLVSGSYILSKELELSGGFAMFFWVKHVEGGPPNIPDFVVSLGGFSPYFNKPKHYPSVDRVGVKYQNKEKHLTIKGGYYYALTPSSVMAGGYLTATYTSGSFKAWFNAEANFLLTWKPLAYRIGIAISVGASLTITILGLSKTISATIGASLDLWGQPFGGFAEIDFYLFTVPVSLGGTPPEKPAVPWNEFRDSFLAGGPGAPGILAPRTVAGRTNSPINAPTNPQTTNSPFLLVKVVSGLAPTPKPDAAFLGMIRGEGFAIELAAKIPVKTITFNTKTVPVTNTGFGVGPVEIPDSQFQSAMSATLQRETVRYDDVTITLTTASAPKALWRMDADPLSSDTLLADVASGILLTAPIFIPDRTIEIDVAKLLFNLDPTRRQFALHPDDFPATDTFPQDPWQKVLPSIDAQKAERDKILAVLGQNFVLPSAITITSDYGPQLLEDPEYRLLGEVKVAV